MPGGNDTGVIEAAGLPEDAVAAWKSAHPQVTSDYGGDARSHSGFWLCSHDLLTMLPPKPRRSPAEQSAAEAILGRARDSRDMFLRTHVVEIYDRLTDRRSKFLRMDALLRAASVAVPGIVPTQKQLADEAALKQGDKDGLQIDQGILLARVLAHEEAGSHLCHAMLLPRPESAEALARFEADGVLELGHAALRREGQSVRFTLKNPRFLNAEDQTTLAATETAVDVAILDCKSSIGVFRGGLVEHHKYSGRPVLGAGINLTRLYRGEIPYLWFLERDLGYVHKLFRGVALPDRAPDDESGGVTEKPWIAAVDAFAIGGHCQLLLAMDYVLAASDAWMTLPARKEGIIPGFANLRLPRFVGDRIARQAIQYERRLLCNSAEGRMICDEIVAADAMDEAISRVVDGLTNAGAVSAVGNRRAFRIAQEPLDAFRRYASVYAREQAYCVFSPALIANLERHWQAHERAL